MLCLSLCSLRADQRRDRSAKMVERRFGLRLIGGGQLEYLAISHARERLLAQENEPEIRNFTCGSRANVAAAV